MRLDLPPIVEYMRSNVALLKWMVANGYQDKTALLRRIRDFAQIKGEGIVNQHIARYGLSALDVDEHGLDEMDKRIVANYERGLTTTVNDIEHIESQSLTGVSVIKVFFQPTANIQTAIAQVVAIEQAQVRQLPPGITPPLIIKYSASSIPVVQLGLSSATLPEQSLFDAAVNLLRPQLITIPGAAIPFPYGGKNRLVSVDLDLQALQARGLAPADVVSALNVQNLILPAGTAKFGGSEVTVRMNGSPETVAGLNELPVRTQGGATVLLRDVAQVRDGYAPQTNVVRQDGARGVLLSVLKNGGASTMSIVSNLREMLPRAAQTLPPDIKITPLFDQSVFVAAAIKGVVAEALVIHLSGGARRGSHRKRHPVESTPA